MRIVWELKKIIYGLYVCSHLENTESIYPIYVTIYQYKYSVFRSVYWVYWFRIFQMANHNVIFDINKQQSTHTVHLDRKSQLLSVSWIASRKIICMCHYPLLFLANCREFCFLRRIQCLLSSHKHFPRKQFTASHIILSQWNLRAQFAVYVVFPSSTSYFCRSIPQHMQ